MIRPAMPRLVHQPWDLYAGGVITQRAHRELKRIMRFVNKKGGGHFGGRRLARRRRWFPQDRCGDTDAGNEAAAEGQRGC